MEQMRSIADSRSATLLLHCDLRVGLAAELTRFVQAHGGRIVYHDHYVDSEINRYYTRLQWDLANFTVADGEISDHLTTLAGSDDARWSLSFSDRPRRMAVFVSKEPWCLYDILARTYSGEWPVEIPVIVANHPDLKSVADRFGIPFRVMPMTADNKAEIEEAQLALLAEHRDRPCGAGEVHADCLGAFCAGLREPDHQHPPRISACVSRRASLPLGARSRRQDRRGDRALRDRGAGRGPDH